MSRMVLAALTLAALAACGRGDRSDVASADSLNRDLQLAPVDTSATLNDRPAGRYRDPGAARDPRPGADAEAEAQAGSAPAARLRLRRPSRRPRRRAPAALSAGTALAVTTDAEIQAARTRSATGHRDGRQGH